MEDIEQIVESLSEGQKRAVLLFGETQNLYRYYDDRGFYREPFLWGSSKWTSESAPENTLNSLYYRDITDWFRSEYCGVYYFLTDFGKEVLRYLKTDNSIQNYIKTVKRISRPPLGECRS